MSSKIKTLKRDIMIKKLLLLNLLFGCSIFSYAQLQKNVLNLATNDLVYDSVSNKIYATVPSANGANGNSIAVINPNTYQLENTIFIGSEPTVLAISDDGQYIYTGFSGSSTVRRFNVATQTASIQFSLGTDNSTGSYYVEDIEVMPGQPTTIAIARKNNGYSPRHEGVAIYDNAVMRPTTTPDHTGSNRIEFTGPNTLIGYNNESTEYGIRKLSVNSLGVTNLNVTQSVLSNFYLDFIYKDNYMYSFDGKVVDVSATPFVIGQFTNATGPVVYDSYYNRVCFASFNSNGTITFKRYNPNTFLLFDSLIITQATGPVKNIITCGNGCYAFNTSDNKVVFLKDSTLGTPEIVAKNNINVYPNPATDFLYIQSDFKILNVTISDLNGRTMKNVEFDENKVNINHLQSGIYLAQLVDINGKVVTKKIIKK